ncbi:hypothetical protein QQM79_07805 [Marinobacteraceae bacterium S3BR75-40.1]
MQGRSIQQAKAVETGRAGSRVGEKIVRIAMRRPDAALEALERQTGLRWGTMPRSLLRSEPVQKDVSEKEREAAIRRYSA